MGKAEQRPVISHMQVELVTGRWRAKGQADNNGNQKGKQVCKAYSVCFSNTGSPETDCNLRKPVYEFKWKLYPNQTRTHHT